MKHDHRNGFAAGHRPRRKRFDYKSKCEALEAERDAMYDAAIALFREIGAANRRFADELERLRLKREE